MHQSLRLENLESLPISVRRFATPAAKGSVPDLERLIVLLRDAEDPKLYQKCLPVFYAHLDPARIPTEENLCTIAATRGALTLSIFRDMTYLEDIKFLRPPLPDLWARVWPWLVFFHAHRESLLPPFGRPDAYVELVSFVCCFHDLNTPFGDAMSQTAGLRFLLMDAWPLLLDSCTEGDLDGFDDFCDIICHISIKDPQHAAEILRGAGSPMGLASLVLRSINVIIHRRRSSFDEDSIARLQELVQFLGNLKCNASITRALVSAGVPGALTSAARECMSMGNDPATRLRVALDCLGVLQNLVRCHRAMRASLSAGLLRLVVDSASMSSDIDAPECLGLRIMLSQVLPASTVYSSVLTQLKRQLTDDDHALEVSDKFQNPTFKSLYQSFLSIAHDRIALMEEIDSTPQLSLKACDNMECGVIRPKAHFRRCARCKYVHYCSPECQSVDWKHGHRDACNPTLALEHPDLGARNFAFMRALLARDLAVREHHPILENMEHLPALRAAVDETDLPLLITVVDYLKGRPTIKTTDIHSYMSTALYWDERTARAARSHGRMELHVMIIQDASMGLFPRELLIPQRSDRAGFHAGLVEMLWEMERSEPDMDRAILEFLATVEGHGHFLAQYLLGLSIDDASA
ncbi:hypothetical protein C8R46DRAFT_1356107 [Mycena filopes]|nr:hypothetical protein C8R46DRAFT_1356107 [Mycena filopes]